MTPPALKAPEAASGSVYDLAAQLARSHPVEILFGARSQTDLMAIEDFEALGIALRTATEDGSAGTRGLVTELLETALDEFSEGSAAPSGNSAIQNCRVYTCGPTAMMKRCAELAAQRGVPCVAALENVMACGFGVCLGCATPLTGGGFALVCRDGPAFDADAIDWERLS